MDYGALNLVVNKNSCLKIKNNKFCTEILNIYIFFYSFTTTSKNCRTFFQKIL